MDRTIEKISGPRTFPLHDSKFSPKHIPSPKAAATKATPSGAASFGDKCAGSLHALKSDTMAYC
jgi:hypothetical protein